MAKAKKQPAHPASASSTESAGKAARKPPAKKDKAQASPAAKAPAAPLIDTSLAAQAAARMVTHKDSIASANSTGGKAPEESSMFKQMKENLNKPATSSSSSFLQSIAPAKKFNTPAGYRNQQVGRNQTFGADVNRSGVPRRTGG